MFNSQWQEVSNGAVPRAIPVGECFFPVRDAAPAALLQLRQHGFQCFFIGLINIAIVKHRRVGKTHQVRHRPAQGTMKFFRAAFRHQLMWAEAINEQAFSPDAVDLVNSVRQRAGVALLNSSPATAVGDQGALRERIRNERRMEFPNEGINYFDELRWGTWKTQVFKPGAGIKQIWGSNVSTYTYQGDYITRWPIPATEIQMNPALQQNDDWIN